jgi:hypothetical protein
MQENNYNNDHNGNMLNRDIENFNHRSNRELLALVTVINERTREIEKTIKELSTAYVKNDLGEPDYDGHRKSHIQMDKQADIVDNYKKSVTETVITWVVTGLLILITSAAIESIRHYLLASNT